MIQGVRYVIPHLKIVTSQFPEDDVIEQHCAHGLSLCDLGMQREILLSFSIKEYTV